MPAVPTVPDLLATGGWAVGDAPARAAEAPETFVLPSAAALAALVPGSAVRLLVDLVDIADVVRDGVGPYDDAGRPNLVVVTERMWFWVAELDADRLALVLQNLPYASHTRLTLGSTVVASNSDVIDLDPSPPAPMADELAALAAAGFPVRPADDALAPEDPHRAPTIDPRQAEACAAHGVAPHRPWPFARCLVGRSVSPESAPIYAIRSRPRPERGDCGWAVWAGSSDMGEAEAADGFDVVEVRDLHRRSPAAWRLLALPPGHGFVVAPDHEDVFLDPELLQP